MNVVVDVVVVVVVIVVAEEEVISGLISWSQCMAKLLLLRT